MFTIDQIKTAHAKVKSGADFPAYIQELIKLGVTGYESFVTDGHAIYYGSDNYTTQSKSKYDALHIADSSDKETFVRELKAHQQGKSTYPEFCNISAETGIEKWVVNMSDMTCIYYDKSGNEILVETIPGG